MCNTVPWMVTANLCSRNLELNPKPALYYLFLNIVFLIYCKEFLERRMKNFILTIVLCIAFVDLQSQNEYNRYPRYKEVVKYYFDNYEASNVPESNTLNFEKRPDGWHLTLK